MENHQTDTLVEERLKAIVGDVYGRQDIIDFVKNEMTSLATIIRTEAYAEGLLAGKRRAEAACGEERKDYQHSICPCEDCSWINGWNAARAEMLERIEKAWEV